jgi:hypothetical protein
MTAPSWGAMPEITLIRLENSSHNVPATTASAETRLIDLATLYLVTDVVGQPPAHARCQAP